MRNFLGLSIALVLPWMATNSRAQSAAENQGNRIYGWMSKIYSSADAIESYDITSPGGDASIIMINGEPTVKTPHKGIKFSYIFKAEGRSYSLFAWPDKNEICPLSYGIVDLTDIKKISYYDKLPSCPNDMLIKAIGDSISVELNSYIFEKKYSVKFKDGAASTVTDKIEFANVGDSERPTDDMAAYFAGHSIIDAFKMKYSGNQLKKIMGDDAFISAGMIAGTGSGRFMEFKDGVAGISCPPIGCSSRGIVVAITHDGKFYALLKHPSFGNIFGQPDLMVQDKMMSLMNK